jgi:ribosome-associated protein
LSNEISSKDAALVAARAADEKKATDIVIQDVSELLKVTDYFVICTAANNRRVDAVAEEIEDKLREECGMKPFNREGLDESTWVLLDYGSIVVHIFQPQQRDFYRLEQLWEQAPTIDVAVAGIEDPVYSARIAALLGKEANAQ